jgi:hypothetical protein
VPIPFPAEIGLAAAQLVPFQNWLVRSPPSVMQLLALPHATTPAQAQERNRLRQEVPLKIIASECRTWSVVV